MNRIRGFAVLTMVLAGVGLVGCGAVAAPDTRETSTPVESSPSSPVETPMATVTQVFEGDCDTAFPPATISSIWGPSARLVPVNADSPDRSAVEQLGGMVCTWTGSEGQARADLAILPVGATTPTNLGDPFCYGPCSFGVESDGLWLSGVVSDAQGDEGTSRQIVATLADAFASSAAASAAKNLAISPPSRGSWSAASDCEDLSQAAELPALLGDPPFVAFQGNGMAEVAEGRTAAIASAGVSSCVWDALERRGFTMKALPGGAWTESELRQTGTAEYVSVPGAQSSFFLTRDSGGADLEVFSEGNWMALHSNYVETDTTRSELIAIAEALLPAMPTR